MTRRRRSVRGRLITLEGGEGVGKSTHMKFVAGYLRARGIKVHETREPGGTPGADEIRKTLLAMRNESFQPMAELLLMFAARALHVGNVIGPALNEGTWVVCDRFTDASYAYQGGGRGIPVAQIATLERMVLKGLRPDLTILLDADIKLGLERVNQRGAPDRFEQESDAFFKRVRRVYLARAKTEPRRIKVMNAAATIKTIQIEIAGLLDDRLARWL